MLSNWLTIVARLRGFPAFAYRARRAFETLHTCTLFPECFARVALRTWKFRERKKKRSKKMKVYWPREPLVRPPNVGRVRSLSVTRRNSRYTSYRFNTLGRPPVKRSEQVHIVSRLVTFLSSFVTTGPICVQICRLSKGVDKYLRCPCYKGRRHVVPIPAVAV